MTDRERLVRRLNDWGTLEAESLADYLLANGVIVLPCKVGKILYCESAIKGYITYLVAPDLEWIFENREKFGKEIFFTREEAEEKLKECKRNV